MRQWHYIVGGIIILLVGIFCAGALVLAKRGEQIPETRYWLTTATEPTEREWVVDAWNRTAASATAKWDLSISGMIEWGEVPISLALNTQFNGDAVSALRGSGEVTVRAEAGEYSATGAGTITLDDGQAYLMLTTAPALPFFNLEELLNRWYELPSELTSRSPYQLVSQVLREPSYGSITEIPSEREQERTFEFTAGDISYWRWKNAIAVFNRDSRLLERVYGHVTSVNGKQTFTFEIIVSDYNEPATEVVPDNSEPVYRMVQDVVNRTNMLEAPVFLYLIGIDSEPYVADADGDGLYAIWERWLGTSLVQADSDGDGYTDREELENGFNPRGDGRLGED